MEYIDPAQTAGGQVVTALQIIECIDGFAPLNPSYRLVKAVDLIAANDKIVEYIDNSNEKQ